MLSMTVIIRLSFFLQEITTPSFRTLIKYSNKGLGPEGVGVVINKKNRKAGDDDGVATVDVDDQTPFHSFLMKNFVDVIIFLSV